MAADPTSKSHGVAPWKEEIVEVVELPVTTVILELLQDVCNSRQFRIVWSEVATSA
jgi:hypothetical protein